MVLGGEKEKENFPPTILTQVEPVRFWAGKKGQCVWFTLCCFLARAALIRERTFHGLLSWDVESTKCNLLGLEAVCSGLESSKESESELLIQYSTENLAVEVLLNPHVSTLKQCLKNLLAANVGHKHVIHAGYAFTGSGSWLLQDGSFSPRRLHRHSAGRGGQRALRRHRGYTIHVHCIPEGPWAQKDEEEGALTKIYESLFINPASRVSVVPGSAILLSCLDKVLRFQPFTELMKSSPVVGNIRFNRPTLYVFPGGQGDCALFGVSGFTMLIDGGFNRKPCFWEFIRHLDRLDAIMITRLNENNVCGITNVIRRKKRRQEGVSSSRVRVLQCG
ncbi:microtubule-associated protein futsch [Caerostris extrusa]|uniref:Microtubule-associated protein futsch n=1 Tax=Caerostris extrusa TaxID=172846 RepID=A0AAV4XHH4_CAEEX|nr:microtubule-associated protein futsch [Caerostris extrusa]